MWMTRDRLLGATGALVLCSTVLYLGWQNRLEKQINRQLVTRFTEPHRGVFVPGFTTRTIHGESITIGEMDHAGRQVLYFFTADCDYCRKSLPFVRRIIAVTAHDTVLRPQFVAISLDSLGQAIPAFLTGSVPVVRLNDRKLPILYRVQGVPTLIVVDSSGRTTFASSGEIDQSALDSILPGISWSPKATTKPSLPVSSAR